MTLRASASRTALGVSAAAAVLMLPLLAGCSAPRMMPQKVVTPVTAASIPPPAEEFSEEPEIIAHYAAAVAMDLEAGRLIQLFNYQRMSRGVNQPSLLREARRRREASIEEFDKALALSGPSATLYRRKGDVYLELARFGEALRLFRKARRLAGAEPQWYFRTANRLEHAGRPFDAAMILNEAAETPGVLSPEFMQQALLEAARLSRTAGRWDMAEKALRGALAELEQATEDPVSAVGRAFAEGMSRDPSALRRLLVQVLVEERKFDEAVDEGKKALEESPSDPRALSVLINAYTAAGRTAEALKDARGFVNVNPFNQLGVLTLMRLYDNAGRTDRAIDAGKAYIEGNESDTRVKTEILELYRKAGRTREAEDFALGAGGASPALGESLALLDVYIQADEDDKAADLAEKILDENRFDEKIAIQVVARLSKGWSTEEVAAFSDSYREKHPDDFRTMYARARVLAGRGMAEEAGALFVALAENGAHYSQIYEAAAVYLLDKGDVYRAVVLLLNGVENGFVVRPELFTERFVALAGDAGALAERLEGVVGDYDTALVQLQEIIGALYGSVDNDVKAEEYFRETLKDASPKLTNYVGLVLALYGQDRVDEAIEVVEEIIGKGQGAPPVLRMLVMMLSDEGRIKEAEQLARRIVAEGPTDVENRMALVGVLIDRSDYAAAEQELLRARSLAEGDEDLLLRVRYFLGIVYEEQGKGDLAMSMWQANITVDPGHADSNNAIAYHWAEAGENLPTALAYVKKALESDPESAPFLDTLGWIHYKMGNYEDAARELQKAADKLDDPVILDHLGDALLRLDKTESALEAWKSALENDPQPDDRSAIERKIEEHSSGGNSKGDSAGGDNGGS